jgi:hypothetical protein
MADITTKKRATLKASQFGLPNTRQYPLDTPKRAANAKSRAKEQLDAGNLSQVQYKQIVSRANAALKAFAAKK